MSEVNTESYNDLVVGTPERNVRLDKLAPAGLLIGGLGGIISIGLMFAGYREPMLGSWLFGWVFWLSITLGMFGLTILHHTVRGSWSVSILRLLESGGGYVMFIVMAALFLPVLLQVPVLYEWARPEEVARDQLLQHKAFYLNMGALGWPFRFFLFFGSWTAMAWGFRNSTRRQEAGAPFKLEEGRSSWGAPSLVYFGLSITFAFTDWVMSLEPHWYSTMYGVWQMVASALGAVSLCTLILCLNAKKSPYNEIVAPNLTKDLGNIMFMFTMLWAYTSVSQFLIIWNGNLPETTQYYVRRSHLGWNAVGMATIVGQFLIPWMTLLSPRVKRYPYLLAKIAGWIFCVHIIDVYQVVVPALPGNHGHGRGLFEFFYFDILAFVTVGGIWVYFFATQIAKSPLLPKYDNRLQEALKHAH